MITTKKVTTRRCDQCQTRTTDDGQARFGGSVFTGWFNVEQVCGSTALYDLRKQKTFDLCSAKCLEEFAETLQMPKEAKGTEEHF